MKKTMHFSAEKLLAKAINKRIKQVTLEDDALIFQMEDGFQFGLYDAGQESTEERYMTCGDDLRSFAGATLLGAEVADAPNIRSEDGLHEVRFLRIRTDAGTIVAETHNRHNGYYGGFWIRIEELPLSPRWKGIRPGSGK